MKQECKINTFSQLAKKWLKTALRCTKNVAMVLWPTLLCSVMAVTTVYAGGLDANAGVAQFDAVVSFLAAWIGRIGGLVMFLGVVQFALAVYNQSPEGKINGFLVLVAGAMLVGIAVGYHFFLGVGD